MAQVEDPKAASELLRSYGTVKFKFIDTSGCRADHSIKDRSATEVTEDEAKDNTTLGIAKRGHAKMTIAQEEADGSVNVQVIGWARTKEVAVFAEAERVLKAALREVAGLIQRCSIRVGGARAVPATRYEDFAAAKTRCKEIQDATNNHPAVLEANQRLRLEKKSTIGMSYNPGLFPELSLSDPEDLERAERIRASVAEAVGLVISACRSGDRERIRYVIDQVGALGDSVTDPKLQGEVKSLLQLAESTVQAITTAGLARSAVLRSNTDTPRGQAAVARLSKAQLAEQEARQQLLAKVEGIGQIFESFEESEPTSQAKPAQMDLPELEQETPEIPQSAEDLIIETAAQTDQPAKSDFSVETDF